MKKTISVFLSFVFVLYCAVCAFTAFSADVVDSGFCGGEGDGTNLSWTLDSDGVMRIVGSGKMLDHVYSVDELTPWWSIQSSIKKLVISDGVTSVGNNTFTFSSNLVEVELPDSIERIGSHAFMSCTKLAQPDWPASLREIGQQAFYQNYGITELRLPEGLKTIGNYAFEYCDKLEAVYIPASTTSISSNAFGYCCNLKNFHVDERSGSFSSDENGVLYSRDKSILYNYPAGSDAEIFAVPGSVRRIKTYAFHSAANLCTIEIPDAVESVEKYVFHGCEKLRSLRFPAGLSRIENTQFTGCSSLESIVIPSGVTEIDENIIPNSDSFKYIFFLGSSDQWNELSIDPNNEVLLGAAIHFNADDHTPGEIETVTLVPPTCASAGKAETIIRCTQCGLELEKSEIDLSASSHENSFFVAESAATYDAHGFTEGVFCPDCEQWISGHEVIHNTLGERIILREPTEDEEGLAEIYCTVCGESGLYAIEKKSPPSDGGIAGFIRKAARGIINWFLRLIKWLGGKK